MTQTVLLDLDDTLIVDDEAATSSFNAAARLALSRCRIDPEMLAQAARGRARKLWHDGPRYEYCARIGMSSWEGLWCRFEGDGPDECALRDWSPTYRREAWRLALEDQGIDDPQLAEELGERFGEERRARHEVFDDVVAALEKLKGSCFRGNGDHVRVAECSDWLDQLG